MGNNLPSLYELTKDYADALHHLSDIGCDEQTIADSLEGMKGDIQTKSTNVAYVLRNLETTADAIREAEGQMAARRKAIEARTANLRKYLKTSMELAGISKIESPMLVLTIKKNTPLVVIDAPGQIPCELYVYPEAPEPYPDKKLIASKLKAGEEVTGAHLEIGTHLEIR